MIQSLILVKKDGQDVHRKRNKTEGRLCKIKNAVLWDCNCIFTHIMYKYSILEHHQPQEGGCFRN